MAHISVTDTHFRVLGIPRGCDETALRKAFRQKALNLHPDRNPNGADEFKKVNEAYEALQQHFRRNGGRDVLPHAPPSNAGTGFQYARQAREPPCHFTEEELFGCSPGGFSHERRGYGAKCYARFGGRRWQASGNSGDNNVGGGIDLDGGSMPFGGFPVGSKEEHQRVDERWRQAHGRRVPVSGYSYARGGAASCHARSHPFSHNHNQQQQQQQQRPPQSSSPPFNGASGSPMTEPKPNGGEKARGTGEGSSSAGGGGGGAAGSNDKSYTHASSSLPSYDGSYTQQPNEKRMSSDELYREWERLMREFDSKTSATGGAFRDPCEWEWDNSDTSVVSDGEDSQDTDDDDDNDDNDEENYVFNKKKHPASSSSRRARTCSSRFSERNRLNETHMRSIIEEKIQLKKILFTQRYTPDPADVALMSDNEVYVLCEVLRDVEQRMQKVLVGRLTKGLCSRCMKAPKMQGSKLFTCGHASVCSECACTCAVCPICAATSRR